MNILVVGDSFSSLGECCLGDDIDSHYANLIANKGHSITNLSVGGQNNKKIAHKVCMALLTTPNFYDLIIIQWSALFRLSLNQSNTVYENSYNFTQTEPREFKSFWKTWNKHFTHPRIEVVEFLTQIYLLENFLKSQPIPYVFVKGFENFLSDLQVGNWRLTSKLFKDTVLHVDQLPDVEIDHFYNELLVLYSNLKHSVNWLNLSSPSWFDQRIDFGVDRIHPGPLTHQQFYHSLENYIKKIGFSF